MVKKVRDLNYKSLVRLTVLMVISFRLFCHLFYTTEQEFQLFKDLELYKAMALACVVIAIYRGINIKDAFMWVYMMSGACILFGYFKFQQISPSSYGPEYFKLVSYRGILWVLFIGLMIDMLRHRPYNIRIYLNHPFVILYLLFAIVFIVTNKDSIIPFVCPGIALLFTRLADDKKREMTTIFSLSSYLAFVKIFTTSLIQRPDNYEGGRYYGVFQNVGSAGASCAVALIACIYMGLVFKRKRLWIGVYICALFAVYPCVAIAMGESRSVELGVCLAVLGIWVFSHDKSIKTTYIRFAIAFFSIMLIPVVLFGLSKLLYTLIEAGRIDVSKLNYFWDHVLRMTTAESMEDCIFEPGTFLFALDALASTRVSIYAEKIRWIRLTGFNEYSRIGYNSHNFFLANLVRYGLVGGIPFIGWFFTSIFSCAKRIKEKEYLIYPILVFLLMLGCYSTQSLYINCMGGCLLLLTQPLLIDNCEGKMVVGN